MRIFNNCVVLYIIMPLRYLRFSEGCNFFYEVRTRETSSCTFLCSRKVSYKLTRSIELSGIHAFQDLRASSAYYLLSTNSSSTCFLHFIYRASIKICLREKSSVRPTLFLLPSSLLFKLGHKVTIFLKGFKIKKNTCFTCVYGYS